MRIFSLVISPQLSIGIHQKCRGSEHSNRDLHYSSKEADFLEESSSFKIVVEPDEDRWFAYAPELEDLGGANWGFTKEEALKHIDEVVHMVIEGLIEDGIPIPVEPEDAVQVSDEPAVSVMA